MLRFEQTTPEIFDLPAIGARPYADGRSKDITVVINDRVVEVHEALDGAFGRYPSASGTSQGRFQGRAFAWQ